MSYPAFLDLADKQVLVIGGGLVAARKTKSLLRAKAKVTAIAPKFDSAFQKLKCPTIKRKFRPSDLKAVYLVVSATDDKQVNQQVAKLANVQRIFINVVDQPELCSFTVPAIARSGKLQIAISTEGASPILAQKIRKVIQPELRDLSKLAKSFGELRKKVQKKIGTPASRKKFWQKIVKEIDA